MNLDSLRSTLLTYDRMLTGSIRASVRSRILRGVTVLAAHAGNSAVVIPGLMIWWLVKGIPEYRHFIPLWGSLFLASMITIAVKFAIRRNRPIGGRPRLFREADPFSFPSGHAVRCFNIAACVLFIYSPGVGLMLMGWAAAVTVARVANGIHYFSDIAAGALIGILLAALSSTAAALGLIPVISV